jgi:hypothetical protein
MSNGLLNLGIDIHVIQDTSVPIKTDAVFPNNWFTTHEEEGRIYLFPMFSPKRREERREDILDQLREIKGYTVNKELLDSEEKGKFLEGTGSMILDREHKIIYACYSIRTDKKLLKEFAKMIDYKVVGYNATDKTGLPYYHTNVIMTLGTKLAIICLEAITDVEERESVIKSLASTKKEIIAISREQVEQYAGNMLELQTKNQDKPVLIMSTAAYKSLTNKQLNIINKFNTIEHFDLSTIEKYGGGSARCMIAELF